MINFVSAGCLYIHVCLKIQFSLKMLFFFFFFDITWYAEAKSKNVICKKSSFLLVRESDREKLTKCDEVEWNEKCHYASSILFEWCHTFYCYIILLWEKVTSFEKFSRNLTLKVLCYLQFLKNTKFVWILLNHF